MQTETLGQLIIEFVVNGAEKLDQAYKDAHKGMNDLTTAANKATVAASDYINKLSVGMTQGKESILATAAAMADPRFAGLKAEEVLTGIAQRAVTARVEATGLAAAMADPRFKQLAAAEKLDQLSLQAQQARAAILATAAAMEDPRFARLAGTALLQQVQQSNQAMQAQLAAMGSAAANPDYGKAQGQAVLLTKQLEAANKAAELKGLEEALKSGALPRLIEQAAQLDRRLADARARMAQEENKARYGSAGATALNVGGQLGQMAQAAGPNSALGGLLARASEASNKLAGMFGGFKQAGDSSLPILERFKGGLAGVGGMASIAGGAIMGVVDMAKNAASAAMTMVGSLAQVGQVASGVIGMFVHGAAQNTVEAYRLGIAWEILTRTVGGMFAPAVRQATELVKELTAWFRGLDDETKGTIQKVALVTAGLAALASVAPFVLGAVAAVGAGIMAALTPPGLLVVGLTAGLAFLGYALLDLGNSHETMGDKAHRVIKTLLDAWTYAKAVGSAAFTFIAEVMKTVVIPAIDDVARFTRMAFGVIGEVAKMLGPLFESQMVMIGASILGTLAAVTASIRGTMVFIQEIIDKARAFAKIANINLPPFNVPKVPDFEEIKKKFERAGKDAKAAYDKAMAELDGNDEKAKKLLELLGKFTGGGSFKIKFDVQFESLQGTWDRLQKAMATLAGGGVEEAQLGELQQINEGIQKVIASIDELQPGMAAG